VVQRRPGGQDPPEDLLDLRLLASGPEHGDRAVARGTPSVRRAQQMREKAGVARRRLIHPGGLPGDPAERRRAWHAPGARHHALGRQDVDQPALERRPHDSRQLDDEVAGYHGADVEMKERLAIHLGDIGHLPLRQVALERSQERGQLGMLAGVRERLPAKVGG
jgi:hypothetical protein